jgi:hypothetical protein
MYGKGWGMSDHRQREAALLADAVNWRRRVVADAESEQATTAADAHRVETGSVIEAATVIAGYISRGALEVIGEDLPRRLRPALAFLVERGHLERFDRGERGDNDLFRPVGVRRGELPLA